MTTNNQNPGTRLATTQRGRLAIYQRPTAEKAQTPQLQSLDLEVWARERGYTDISVFAERYIPGDPRIVLPEALNALKKAIEGPPDRLDSKTQEGARQLQKPITAILVASVDSLFRSGSMLEDIALFLNLCSSHGITVITPVATYDFCNESDVVQFCFLCLTASQGVERATLTRQQQGKRAAAARRQGKTAS
jgi:hypothetical protein